MLKKNLTSKYIQGILKEISISRNSDHPVFRCKITQSITSIVKKLTNFLQSSSFPRKPLLFFVCVIAVVSRLEGIKTSNSRFKRVCFQFSFVDITH